MRIVIYDDEDMEPITVVSLRGVTMRDIQKMGRRWRIPVPERFSMLAPAAPPSVSDFKVVELEFEPFIRKTYDGREQRSWMAFTKASDLAMLLIPDWLPGQRPAVEELQKQNDHLTRMIMVAMGFD